MVGWLAVTGAPGLHADERAPDPVSIGKKLDRVAKMLEEFGTVSLSSPVLVPADKTPSPFAFGLGDSPAAGDKYRTGSSDFFFDLARNDTELAASTSDSMQFALQFAASANVSAPAMTLARLKQQRFAENEASYERWRDLERQRIEATYAADLAAIPSTLPAADQSRLHSEAELKRIDALKKLELSNRPSLETSTDSGEATSGANPLDAKKGALVGEGFHEVNILNRRTAADPQLKVSARSALITAAGHKATHGLLAVLGAPGTYVKFEDKKLLFGVAMVNVDPGWRTREDFVGEVTVRVSYEYQPARPEIIRDVIEDETQGKPELQMAQELIEAWDPRWARLPKEPTAGLAYIQRRLVLLADEIKLLSDSPSVTGKKDERQRLIKEITDRQDIWCKALAEKSSAFLKDPKNKSAKEALTKSLGDTFKELAGDIAEKLVGIKKLTSQSAKSGGVDTLESGHGGLDTPMHSASLASSSMPLSLLARESSSPLVAAVSPMTDAQTADLAGSTRRQWEMAANLAAAFKGAGYDAQAKLFASFAKRLERDVQSRSSLPTLTAFSQSGGIFGFRAGPRLRALDNVKKLSAEPGNTLERQAFPVLILIGLDADDVGLRFRYEGGKPVPVEPVLRFTQTTRWSPLHKSWYPKLVKWRQSQTEYATTIQMLIELDRELQRSDPQALRDLYERADAYANDKNLGKAFADDAEVATNPEYRLLASAAYDLLEKAQAVPPSKATCKPEQSMTSTQKAGNGSAGTSDSAPLWDVSDPIQIALTNIRGGNVSECSVRKALCAAKQRVGKALKSGQIADVGEPLRERVRTLSYLAEGSWNTQSLPLEFFVPKKPEKIAHPLVEQLVPDRIAVAASDPKIKTTIALRGRDIPEKFTLTWNGADGLTLQSKVGAPSADGSFVLVELTGTGALGDVPKTLPLYGVISIGGESAPQVAALTPTLTISLPAKPKAAEPKPPEKTITRKTTTTDDGSKKETVVDENISATGVTPAELQSYVEREKPVLITPKAGEQKAP